MGRRELSRKEDAMLGEKLGEEHGKVTSRRVLPGDDYRYVKMEITFETEATILGQKGMNVGTYTVFERVPGQAYGEGQGIFMTMDGQGAIWNGHGIGGFDESGRMKFAASIAFQAGDGPPQRLNNVLVLVEHQTDMEGSAASTLYDWKG
jgi:hypothetical protein